MRKTGELGYVIVTRYVDAEGKSLLLSAYGTHVPFQRAVEDEFRGGTLTPARHQGVPVDALIWLPVIFNPKAANAKSADAAPRLLEVKPVFTKKRPAPQGQPPIVRMRLSLDANGEIVQAEPEQAGVPSDVLTLIAESLRGWRFAPARKAGVPVAAAVSMPVICQPPPRADLDRISPPKPLSRVEPDYPLAMRRFGLQGTVSLNFIIEADGSVANPTIVQSDNPAFDEPAIEALLQWKFKPAMKDGKPVKVRMQQRIRFEIADRDGRDAFSMDGRGDQSKLPPELRYDTPPKIRGVLLPLFPTELRRAGITGRARVVMLVNPLGKVAQVKVVQADRPEFGLALAAATEGFRFDPALQAGRPVSSLVAFEQDFNWSQFPDDKAERLLSLEKRHPDRIFSFGELDVRPKPVSRRAPTFPVIDTLGADHGSALIEFLVDENGRARLPRIVEASEPAFGYSAMQAVAEWWFEPPLKGGKTVVARVRVPFEFSLSKTTAPAGKK
jgi:TonB family protein